MCLTVEEVFFFFLHLPALSGRDSQVASIASYPWHPVLSTLLFPCLKRFWVWATAATALSFSLALTCHMAVALTLVTLGKVTKIWRIFYTFVKHGPYIFTIFIACSKSDLFANNTFTSLVGWLFLAVMRQRQVSPLILNWVFCYQVQLGHLVVRPGGVAVCELWVRSWGRVVGQNLLFLQPSVTTPCLHPSVGMLRLCCFLSSANKN
jgi:hypothetical protein